MTALASSDVLIATTAKNRDFISGVKNLSIVDMTFGDGALTYPTGGIPLPDLPSFNCRSSIDFFSTEGTPDNGYDFRYDRDNHKLLVFSGGTEIANSVTPAAQTLRAFVVGT